MLTLNCKGKVTSFERPLVMGIVNATPDSFYQPSYEGTYSPIKLAENMAANGVNIIDIGGQSTRPGSVRIPADEEVGRVIPILKEVHQRFPELIISIDTYHSIVAEAAVDAGASIINDISGGEMDPAMIPLAARLKTPYICMHMQGTPETMQRNPHYDDIVMEVMQYFIRKTEECINAGIKDLIIDPGFGFGKTIEHNFILLKNLSLFKIFEKPLLAGLSRKGTVYKSLGIDIEKALNGTTVLNTLALMNGADILRVHDVKEAL
ncbi:MAG: dihydropteroate synthase, partial [Ferruginibacter sp.]